MFSVKPGMGNDFEVLPADEKSSEQKSFQTQNSVTACACGRNEACLYHRCDFPRESDAQNV